MLDEPDAKLREPMLGVVAPRVAIVGQDDLGQAIALECRLDCTLHRLLPLVVDRL